MQRRVAFIGLDAVEPRLAERLMDEGVMPRLAELRGRGARSGLKSEATWRSGRVWETLLTGEADFASATLFNPRTYATEQVGSRRKRPFYADFPGLNTLAIDVPYMSLWYGGPPGGAQVIWGGHDAGYPRASRPAGLVREIDAKFGVHPAFHNDFTCAWHDAESIDTLSAALIEGSRRRTAIIGWLMERFPEWGLFMTVLSEAHSAGEMFWHGVVGPDHPMHGLPTGELARRRLVEVYREVDAALGRIIDALPAGTTVVVASVHGMEANHYDVASMAILPELLHRAHGWEPRLRAGPPPAWRMRGCPAITPPPWQKWDDWVRLRFDRSVWRTRAEGARQWWRAMRGKRRRISDLSVPIPPESDTPPEAIDEPRWPVDWQPPVWYRDQWPCMRAFCLPVFYDGRVRLNVRGREAQGIVEPAEYERTLAWVEGLLHECRDLRTGGPVVETLERLRARDPMAMDGPDADLTITWRPGVDGVRHPELGDIGPIPMRRTGGHTDRGFAFAAGPGIGPVDLGLQEALELTGVLRALLGDRNARTFLAAGNLDPVVLAERAPASAVE